MRRTDSQETNKHVLLTVITYVKKLKREKGAKRRKVTLHGINRGHAARNTYTITKRVAGKKNLKRVHKALQESENARGRDYGAGFVKPKKSRIHAKRKKRGKRKQDSSMLGWEKKRFGLWGTGKRGRGSRVGEQRRRVPSQAREKKPDELAREGRNILSKKHQHGWRKKICVKIVLLSGALRKGRDL